MKLSATKSFTHKAKDYTSFYNEDGEPRVNVEGIVEVSGSSSSGGGGFTTYSNSSGDFTATANTGTKTITLSALPFTLNAKNVVTGTIKKIDSSGNVTSVPVTNVTVSGSVITLGDADAFVSGDEVVVNLIGPDKAYDKTSDTSKNTTQNPEWAHHTDPVHLVDETNIAANDYFITTSTLGYRNVGIQAVITDTTGASLKVFGTLDSSAAVPVTGGSVGNTWHELTSDIYGAAVSGTSIDVFEFLNRQKGSYKMYERLLIQYTTDPIVITDETFTSSYDVAVALAHQNLISGTVVVTTTDNVTTYTEGTDYTIDYTNGTITVLSTGTMADATNYYIDYHYSGLSNSIDVWVIKL